jgi:hypothetical protein
MMFGTPFISAELRFSLERRHDCGLMIIEPGVRDDPFMVPEGNIHDCEPAHILKGRKKPKLDSRISGECGR